MSDDKLILPLAATDAGGLLLFTVVPLLELLLLIWVGGKIGTGPFELPEGLLQVPGLKPVQGFGFGGLGVALQLGPELLVQDQPGPELGDLREDGIEGLPELGRYPGEKPGRLAAVPARNPWRSPDGLGRQ